MIQQVLLQRVPEILAMLVLLGFSAFFSGAETALFSLSQEELRKISLASKRSSRRIQYLLGDPQALLATVLFGNMLVNVSIYGLSFLIALDLSRQVSHLAAVACGVVSLLVVIIFGETSPKGIAVSRPVAVAHMVAVPLYYFHHVARPASRLLRGVARGLTDFFARRFSHSSSVTRDELKALAGIAEQQGTLNRRARGMIERVVELSDIRVREVMTPRVDIPVFNLEGDRGEICELVRRTRKERLLAYMGTADNVVGMVPAREVLLFPGADIRDLVRPVRFAPETQSVESLLRQFGKSRDSVAIAVDEYGGTAGLVTLDHILEAIVGEIRDESEPNVTPVLMLDENTYVLAGDLNIREWRPLHDAGFQSTGAETIGGFMMASLGRIPKEGDVVERRGLRFVVEKMAARRVEYVRVERLRPEGAE